MISLTRKVAAPILTIVLFINALFVFSSVLADSFIDLPSNPLYRPAIELFQQQNIIIGKTMGGQPTGQLSPTDHLNRAEFTKVATLVRLLEEKQDEGILSNYMNTDLNDFTLKTNSPLQPYYTSRPGAPKFSDVAEKEVTCAKDPGGCEPWFTQYVNYMASLGTIQGTGGGKFSPNDSIKRIHALKIIMVDNGKIPAEQDLRFIRISNDERIKNRVPRCLAGAEDYILANNGGNTQDAQNLLAYALLADKLDVFGNSCQFFDEKKASTPSARAKLLQEPLTRQEIARYFALTTTIPELQLDPATDPTMDTRSEYIAPVSQELKEEKDPLAKLREEGKLGTENKKNPSLPGSPALTEEEGEASYVGPPVSPEITIEGCYSFKADRGDKEDQIKGCIALLRRANFSDEEINRRLREAGLGEYATNDSLVLRTELVASNKPIPSSLKQNIYNLLDEYNAGHTDMETCRHALEYLTTGKIQQDIAKDWCKEHGIVDEETKIKDNMDADFRKRGSAVNTCKWELKDKSEGSEKYKIVMSWCKSHGVTEEDLVQRSIEGQYTATGKEKIMTFEPNWDNGPNIWRLKESDKPISFRVSGGGGMSADNDYQSNGNDTYILIHGWRSDPSAWASNMSRSINTKNWQSQILLLDWNSIANQFDTYLKFIDIPKSPGKVSKWTMPIVDSFDDPLVDWGIGNNTTVIGHSLGAFIASKLSESLRTKGAGMPSMIALDPDAYPFDFKLDFDNLETMQGFNGNGACFVADASLSGSKKLMKTCRESYLIDYSGDPRSRLMNELYDYVDFVIDEAVAKNIEKIIDGGITYAVEQTINKELGVRIRGVRMYKIAGGRLQEVFLGNLEDMACKKVDGVIKLPYICEYGIKELKDRFVTYHNNVHITYNTVIQNPFYNSLLAPQDIASRRGKAAPFARMGKEQNGTIITEYDQPERIKYLKVIDNNGAFYALYGNTAENNFECRDDKSCVMYGGSGNDIFVTDEYSNNYVIKDFKRNKNSDQILVKGNGSNSGLSSLEYEVERNGTIKLTATCGSCQATEDQKETIYRDIYLEGVAVEQVDEWVSIARGLLPKSYKEQGFTEVDLPSLKADNPIQIK